MNSEEKKKKYHQDFHKSWYNKNKTKRRLQIDKRKAEIYQWFEEYRISIFCVECGESHPACLDFHHLDASEKDLEVPLAVRRGWSKERILKEIAKCVVLCSNCHRKIHYNERKL